MLSIPLCALLQDRTGCSTDMADVVIQDDRTLMGFQSYPVFISKGSLV